MEKVKGPAKLSRLVIFPIGGRILEQVVISVKWSSVGDPVVPFATEIFSIIVASIDSTTERCGVFLFFSLFFYLNDDKALSTDDTPARALCQNISDISFHVCARMQSYYYISHHDHDSFNSFLEFQK